MESSDESDDDFTEESNESFSAWENDVRLFVQAVNSAEQRTEQPAKMTANQDEEELVRAIMSMARQHNQNNVSPSTFATPPESTIISDLNSIFGFEIDGRARATVMAELTKLAGMADSDLSAQSVYAIVTQAIVNTTADSVFLETGYFLCQLRKGRESELVAKAASAEANVVLDTMDELPSPRQLMRIVKRELKSRFDDSTLFEQKSSIRTALQLVLASRLENSTTTTTASTSGLSTANANNQQTNQTAPPHTQPQSPPPPYTNTQPPPHTPTHTNTDISLAEAQNENTNTAKIAQHFNNPDITASLSQNENLAEIHIVTPGVEAQAVATPGVKSQSNKDTSLPNTEEKEVHCDSDDVISGMMPQHNNVESTPGVSSSATMTASDNLGNDFSALPPAPRRPTTPNYRDTAGMERVRGMNAVRVAESPGFMGRIMCRPTRQKLVYVKHSDPGEAHTDNKAHMPEIIARDKWMPDHATNSCGACDRNFTFFRRRHHCRLCGGIFCATCSTARIDVFRCRSTEPATTATLSSHSHSQQKAVTNVVSRPKMTKIRACVTCMSSNGLSWSR